MPIPNPTVWCYRNIIIDGRRLEIRFSRGQKYKYGVDNPADVIYVDEMTFPPDQFGEVAMEEFDQDGDAVPLSWNFAIADQFTFSGKLGDGTVISMQDLRANHTTLTA